MSLRERKKGNSISWIWKRVNCSWFDIFCDLRFQLKNFNEMKLKTKFHHENFALSLTVIMRFTATRKWPIYKVIVGFAVCKVLN